ncbi:MAG TPA: Plug domain-containing protein, partial [Steroidobacter sp.]|nr:Plug domain-containing protein [Steroidobacter sp.]
MRRSVLAAACGFAAVLPFHTVTAAPQATDSGAPLDVLETVSVIGVGESRQVQRITSENLDVLPPGTSLQKMLNRLPGVNAQSVDALGSNEQSMSLSLRGFNTTRLGYTLDGMPLGDGAYNNYNGLSISRALISENLDVIEL